MAIPNLIQVSAVYGRTTSAEIGTAITTVVSNANSSNKSYKVNSLYISNVDGVAPAKITVDFYRATSSIKLIDRMQVSAGDTLVAIGRDTSIYLEEGDSLRAVSDENNRLQLVVSFEVNS